MGRDIIRVPFTSGVGLERQYGAMVAKPGAYSDLRNAHLTGGRMEIRRGLYQAADTGGTFTDVLAIAPLRAALQAVLVVYDEPSREVRLVKAIIDPGTLAMTLTNISGVVWTIPATAQFPVVSITDSFGKAFIAHNEPTFSTRQKTKVYDPLTGLFADLPYNSGPNAVTFRGVARWLSYIVGWGYGTDDTGPPDDRNRPEIVRLSNPGDPEVLQPLFYFIAGQRGEPVLGGAVCALGFLIAKEGELHLITGTSRLDFDIKLVDPNFGVISERAMVEVNGEVFFWSSEGPRVSNGGASVDLGLPLDLGGTTPDGLSGADLRQAHATYRPDREEIEWMFPVSGSGSTFTFTLDLKDPTQRRWSYRRYGRLIRCSGALAGNAAFDTGDPAIAAYLTITDIGTDVVAGSRFYHDVAWTNNNLASLPVGTAVEVWAYSAPYNVGTGAFDSAQPSPNNPLGWLKIGETPAGGGTQTLTGLMFGNLSTTPRPMEFRALAIRYRLADGSYPTPSTPPNPFDWPAIQRAIVQGPAVHPKPALVRLVQRGGDVETWDVQWKIAGGGPTILETGEEVEVWTLPSPTEGVATPAAPLGGSMNVWTKQLPNIVPVGVDVSKTGVTMVPFGWTPNDFGVYRHVALRLFLPGLPGSYDPLYASADPWTWPAEARALVMIPPNFYRPVLVSAAYDGGGPPHLVVTTDIPFNGYAPAAMVWELQTLTRITPPGGPVGGWTEGIPRFVFPSTIPSPQVISNSFGYPGAGYHIELAVRLFMNGVPIGGGGLYPTAHPELWPAESRFELYT